jgi:hypothetical protein
MKKLLMATALCASILPANAEPQAADVSPATSEIECDGNVILVGEYSGLQLAPRRDLRTEGDDAYLIDQYIVAQIKNFTRDFVADRDAHRKTFKQLDSEYKRFEKSSSEAMRALHAQGKLSAEQRAMMQQAIDEESNKENAEDAKEKAENDNKRHRR